MGATEERLAEFVAETDVESIPPEAFRAARDATFDCLGVTLAGAAEPLGGMITSFVEEEGAAPVSTIVGSRLRTSPYLAALANGTLAHALDYDDVGGPGHPSVALTPTVLALGEKLGSSGRDVLEAYVIGFEAASHIRAGSSVRPGHPGLSQYGRVRDHRGNGRRVPSAAPRPAPHADGIGSRGIDVQRHRPELRHVCETAARRHGLPSRGARRHAGGKGVDGYRRVH